jgi:translocation and assembly module TamB
VWEGGRQNLSWLSITQKSPPLSKKPLYIRVSKIALAVLVALAVLLLLAWIAIQQQAVQQRIAQSVVRSLAQKLDTPFSVDKVYLRFFNRAVIEGLYLQGQDGDTLLYAARLEARLEAFSWFKRRIHVKKLTIEGLYANMQRHATDRTYNFQFIIDAFASPDPDTSRAEQIWVFDLNEVNISHTRFFLTDAVEQYMLDVYIDDFSVELDALDLDKQQIAIRQTVLSGSSLRYESWAEAASIPAAEAATERLPSPAFPDVGWDITAQGLQWRDNEFIFKKRQAAPRSGQINYDDLHITGLALAISGFEWAADRLQASVDKLAFAEKSGFTLLQLSTKIKATEQEISLMPFELTTPHSHLRSDFALRFAAFKDLADFDRLVRIEARLSPTLLALPDIQYLTGSLSGLAYFQWEELGQLELEGQLDGKINNLSIQGFKLALQDVFQLQLAGSLQGLPDAGRLRFDLQLGGLSSSYQALARHAPELPLPAGLANLGRVQLSGHFLGSLSDWSGKQVQLETESDARFLGSMRVRDLADLQQAFFELQIDELAATGQVLAGFMEGPLPPQVDSLGQMVYQGSFAGTTSDFHLTGSLQTAIGRISQDLQLTFSQDYRNAAYNGQIALQDFDLGRLLAAPELYGKADLSAQIDGRGLEIDSLAANLSAHLNSLHFNGYDYREMDISGRFERREFKGAARIQDENLALDFNGRIDLNDSLPAFDFVATLDTINLQQLNFYAGPLGMSARIEARLSGDKLDNLSGMAALTGLRLRTETRSFGPETFRLTARQEAPAKKTLLLQSDLAEALISGDFDLEQLPRLLSDFIDGYFPLVAQPVLAQAAATPDTTLTEALAEQDFRFSLYLSNPARLAQLFAPGLSKLDTFVLEASFNSREKQLSLDGWVPELVYQNLRFDSIRLQAGTSAEQLRGKLAIHSVSTSGDVLIPLAEIGLALANDSLQFLAAITELEGEKRLQLEGTILPYGEQYRLTLASPLVLNQEDWKGSPENQAIFALDGSLYIPQMRFQQGQQAFFIQSQGEATKDEPFPSLEIGFEQFQLGELSVLAGLEEGMLEGMLDGSVLLCPADAAWEYTLDLQASQLRLQQTALGTLSLHALPLPNRAALDIAARLEGGAPQLQLNGQYNLDDGGLSFVAKMQALNLSLLEAFFPGYTRDSQGSLSADLAISGSASQPIVEGQIGLHGISTFVEYLQGRYTFSDHTITLKPQAVDFGLLKVQDQAGAQASLSGQIQHEFFDKLRFGLNVNAKQFQFLNTKAGDNPLFYGLLLLDADLRINGTPSLPEITINARTLPRTKLTAQALASEAAIVQEDFILFGRPAADTEGDTAVALQPVYRANTTGIQLALNLEVNPEAVFEAVIDPTTGDKLTSRGRGNITVEMDQAGNLSTAGTYTIVEGSYALNYQNIIQRSFAIRPGSRIELLGDPMASRFDITAVYTSRTTPYSLIARQAEIGALAQKRRSDVRVLLKLKGNLAKPEISFDIEIPPTGNPEMDEALERKLAQLRDQQNDLNMQVFGLLFFNSFIIEDQRPASLANTGENLVLSSVSNLISEQLNALSQRYLRGVELTVGLDSYRAEMAGSDATVAAVDLQLSKRLLDDRLSIQVGGNLDVAGSRAGEEGMSALAGDFLLEYQLTEDGRYRLRVFSRSHYDMLNQNNNYRTGVGLMYKKSYGQRKGRKARAGD